MSGPLFFKLKKGAAIENVTNRLTAELDRSANLNDGAYAGLKPSELIRHEAMALKDLYLNASGWGEMKAPGDKVSVMIMSIIALLVLVIAAVNFANLSTARATKRAREVALRKLVGAQRTQLMVQFLGESILISFVALLFGLVLVDILLPQYGAFLGRDLSAHYDGVLAVAAALLALTVGVAGGAYPALVLSGYLPGRILRSNKSSEAAGSSGTGRRRTRCWRSAGSSS